MDRRVLVLFCLLTAVRSDEAPKMPDISVGEGNLDLKYAENLIQLDMRAVVTVLVSDIAVTIMIGWVIYIICAQPKTRSGYQGNKASDRVNLIENHSRSGGDTYQPLNTRAEEYSTLQARKHKQSV